MEALTNQLIQAAVKAIARMLSGGAGVPIPFAEGGIMTSEGKVPLKRYSSGGIARSPQLAMFGEGSTPEAYVPVPSGRIPVEMKAPAQQGQTVNLQMTVQTPDADSFRRSQPQIMADMQRMLSRQGARGN